MPTLKVGLSVREEIINADEDASLNDNAQGFSNYAAPGADRLKISAVLTSKIIADDDDPNFVELMRIQDGELETFVKNTDYNFIKAEFARRTMMSLVTTTLNHLDYLLKIPSITIWVTMDYMQKIN